MTLELFDRVESNQIMQIIGEKFGGMENSLYICGKIYRYEFKCNDKNDF